MAEYDDKKDGGIMSNPMMSDTDKDILMDKSERGIYENKGKPAKDGRIYMKKGSGGLVRTAQKKSISKHSKNKKSLKRKFHRKKGHSVAGYSALVIADDVSRFILGSLGYKQARPRKALKHLKEILEEAQERDAKGKTFDYTEKQEKLAEELQEVIERCLRKYNKVDWSRSREGL